MAVDRVRVNEGSSVVVALDVLDAAGAVVPAASLSSAILTLYDLDTYNPGSPADGLLNSRDRQSVLNTNDVTIDTHGHVIWTMDPDDNVIVTPRRWIERHRALFLFTWAGGQSQQEIEIEVMNLRGAA